MSSPAFPDRARSRSAVRRAARRLTASEQRSAREVLRQAPDAPSPSAPVAPAESPLLEPKPEPRPEPKVEAKPDTPALPVISPVKIGKASPLWRGMWSRANTDIRTLQDAVSAAMEDDEDVDPTDYATIQANLKSVASLTDRLNLSLADGLEHDELIGLLADTAFHPVSVKSDLLKAVQTIRAVVAAP